MHMLNQFGTVYSGGSLVHYIQNKLPAYISYLPYYSQGLFCQANTYHTFISFCYLPIHYKGRDLCTWMLGYYIGNAWSWINVRCWGWSELTAPLYHLWMVVCDGNVIAKGTLQPHIQTETVRLVEKVHVGSSSVQNWCILMKALLKQSRLSLFNAGSD